MEYHWRREIAAPDRTVFEHAMSLPMGEHASMFGDGIADSDIIMATHDHGGHRKVTAHMLKSPKLNHQNTTNMPPRTSVRA